MKRLFTGALIAAGTVASQPGGIIAWAWGPYWS